MQRCIDTDGFNANGAAVCPADEATFVKVLEVGADSDFRDLEEATEFAHFDFPALADQFQNLSVALQVQHRFSFSEPWLPSARVPKRFEITLVSSMIPDV